MLNMLKPRQLGANHYGYTRQGSSELTASSPGKPFSSRSVANVRHCHTATTFLWYCSAIKRCFPQLQLFTPSAGRCGGASSQTRQNSVAHFTCSSHTGHTSLPQSRSRTSLLVACSTHGGLNGDVDAVKSPKQVRCISTTF